MAAAVVQAAPNAITGMTLLRELSDGFQYREVAEGTTTCTHCTDGTVAEWTDPSDPDRVYGAIDMLDPEVVVRLEKQTIPCPVAVAAARCQGLCGSPARCRAPKTKP